VAKSFKIVQHLGMKVNAFDVGLIRAWIDRLLHLIRAWIDRLLHFN
jgi:hypothetical protein